MATEANKLGVEKLEAEKKAAVDAIVAAAAASSWPTRGYNTLIPLLLIFLCVVLASSVDVSTICLLRDYMVKYQYVLNTAYVMRMIYLWIILIKKLLMYSTEIC